MPIEPGRQDRTFDLTVVLSVSHFHDIVFADRAVELAGRAGQVLVRNIVANHLFARLKRTVTLRSQLEIHRRNVRGQPDLRFLDERTAPSFVNFRRAVASFGFCSRFSFSPSGFAPSCEDGATRVDAAIEGWKFVMIPIPDNNIAAPK